MGFCRVNLFKRLESGGPAFLQSVERHVLRNFVVLYVFWVNNVKSDKVAERVLVAALQCG